MGVELLKPEDSTKPLTNMPWCGAEVCECVCVWWVGCSLKQKESQRAQETARVCSGEGKDAENKIEGSSDEIFPSPLHHLCVYNCFALR